jgi:hypothetical protein
MALLFCDSFDTYSATQIAAKWTDSSLGISFGSPGRLGYGNYMILGTGPTESASRGIPTQATVIVGFAVFINGGAIGNGQIFQFQDNVGNTLCTISTTTSGQIGISNTGASSYYSAPATIQPSTWAYCEAEVTFSNTTTGSLTVRWNGATVASAASVQTAQNGNGCSLLGPTGGSGPNIFYDDLYILSTAAPNNTFFGDTKIIALMPTGNGRVDGWTRVGGTSSGNWTAVDEIPPDGDISYVYTSVPGTEDCYTITALTGVTNVLAVQLSAYARKDDTPSRVLALGVGNGTTENFNAGTSLNTSYSYILRQLDVNPLTTVAWATTDFATLQNCIELIS